MQERPSVSLTPALAAGRGLRVGALVSGVDPRTPGTDRECRRRPGAGLGQTGGPRRRPSRYDGNRAPGSGRAASLSRWSLRSGHVPDRPHPRGRRGGRAARDVPGGSPGGMVLVAEPNNLAGQVVRTSASAQSGPRALASALAFYAACEAGKASLGEGDNSAGDLLPGYFAEAGLTVVACYLSDKTSPLWPPYSSSEEAALAEARAAALSDERWFWTGDQTRRYFLAGGGRPPRSRMLGPQGWRRWGKRCPRSAAALSRPLAAT